FLSTRLAESRIEDKMKLMGMKLMGNERISALPPGSGDGLVPESQPCTKWRRGRGPAPCSSGNGGSIKLHALVLLWPRRKSVSEAPWTAQTVSCTTQTQGRLE